MSGRAVTRSRATGDPLARNAASSTTNGPYAASVLALSSYSGSTPAPVSGSLSHPRSDSGRNVPTTTSVIGS